MGDSGRRSAGEDRGEGMLPPRHPPGGLLQAACIPHLNVPTPLGSPIYDTEALSYSHNYYLPLPLQAEKHLSF